MTAAATEQAWRSSMRTFWTGGPVVVAMLFAHPDSQAIQALDARGEYFDSRTGDTWDLFFPGYHKSDNAYLEEQAGSRRVGSGFAHDWFFNANDFNLFRAHVERASSGRWSYSGGTDLVVVNGYMPNVGDIVIDWESTLLGSLTDADGTQTLTIAQVIERLTTDLESGAEDSAYDLDAVVKRAVRRAKRTAARDITVGALAGIAAAFAKARLGL